MLNAILTNSGNPSVNRDNYYKSPLAPLICSKPVKWEPGGFVFKEQ
jgi:hypothetical protein